MQPSLRAKAQIRKYEVNNLCHIYVAGFQNYKSALSEEMVIGLCAVTLSLSEGLFTHRGPLGHVGHTQAGAPSCRMVKKRDADFKRATER